jgi:hypothetical protein
MIMAMFKIEPIDDEVHTTVFAGNKVWRKRYESATDATTEAVELGMMEAETKKAVDGTLRERGWPKVGLRPTKPVDAVLVESIKPFEIDLERLSARDKSSQRLWLLL